MNEASQTVQLLQTAARYPPDFDAIWYSGNLCHNYCRNSVWCVVCAILRQKVAKRSVSLSNHCHELFIPYYIKPRGEFLDEAVAKMMLLH